MNLSLFIFILFILQIICLIAGGRASKKKQTQTDYFLASREVKFFPLMMTFIATQIGGGLVLGSAEEAYQYGWSVLLYPLGACLGFIVLACGLGKRLAQFQVSTVAQLFEEVYGSVRLKQAVSLLSILSLFMILIAQVIASKKFMLSLGIDSEAIFMLFWGSIILYTVLGGLRAVVSIDMIQATFFIIVFLFGFFYLVGTSDVSFIQSVQSGWNQEVFNLGSSKLTGWLFMPLLFMVIEQDMAQRCFAAQSPRIVTKAAGYAALVTFIICLIPVFFGILGRQAGVEVQEGSSIFMTVAQNLTTPTLAAFLGCAVLAAVISTAISLLNAVSSNLTQDFQLFQRDAGTNQLRWLTFSIGLAAVLFSYYFNNVVDLLIQSYELSIYCLFIPVIAALFRQSSQPSAAIGAMIGGAIGFCVFCFVSVDFPREMISLSFSLIGFGIGEWVSLYKTRWVMILK